MTDKSGASKLSDHVIRKGKLLSPMNASLGDSLHLSSWAKERMPEYLWLGLILLKYGRRDGLERAGKILFEIAGVTDKLLKPSFSSLLNLPSSTQRSIYLIIQNYVDKDTLTPLTVIYRSSLYPDFNEFFSLSTYSVERRVNTLAEAVELFLPNQSNETTDLKFLILSFLGFSDRLKIFSGLTETIEALENYAYTEHDDEKMSSYRPIIRSTEGVTGVIEADSGFSTHFWVSFGKLTPCKPMKIEFEKSTKNSNELITDCRKILEYVLYTNKDKSLVDDKFDVILGSVNYAVKVFDEVVSKDLSNGILGRHGIRTIIEIYIILKYLLKIEDEHPKIWEEYKLYGIGKYKLILLKAREDNNFDRKSHFVPPVAEFLINEIRFEEFVDSDFRYFDNKNIREKSIDVNEKELYDLFYDYDSSFTHGLWGAIRESSMLQCNNPSHKYHLLPDIEGQQNLPDMKFDGERIIKLIFSLLSSLYDFPEWVSRKYEI
jgi:hypothetical protein